MTHATIAVEAPDPVNPFAGPEGNYPLLFGSGTLNVPRETIIENVRSNLQRHVPQLSVHAPTDRLVALVAGGWSLNETFHELRDLYFAGVPMVALNGSGNWLMEHNIRPAMQVVMDARPDNRVFIEEPIPRCKYFLASQCDPTLFELCKDRETYIFHILSQEAEEEDQEDGNVESLVPSEDKEGPNDDVERALIREYYRDRWCLVPGGGTIGTRSISLARILGYQLMHVFGLDSCLSPDGANHAYKQDWNKPDKKQQDVWCGMREFRCSNWHIGQADQFHKYITACGNHFTLNVHGDGLIAHMMKIGATPALTKPKEKSNGC